MTRRMLKFATNLSTALAVGMANLCLATIFTSPSEHCLSLTPSIHISVRRGSRDASPGRVVVFNDAEYGPYRGSIIEIVDPDRKVNPPPGWKDAWADKLGVYYRCFCRRDGQTLWTLAVSLWYPLVVFAAPPAVWFVQRRKERSETSSFSEHRRDGKEC